jgi:hypothetical protein
MHGALVAALIVALKILGTVAFAGLLLLSWALCQTSGRPGSRFAVPAPAKLPSNHVGHIVGSRYAPDELVARRNAVADRLSAIVPGEDERP